MFGRMSSEDGLTHARNIAPAGYEFEIDTAAIS
jgi:hypothetical protein